MRSSKIDMDSYKAQPVVKAEKTPVLVSTTPLRVSLTEDTVIYTVGKSKWIVKTNGSMFISSGSHTFTCGWNMDGSVSAVLYGVMTDLSQIMRYILADQTIRIWLRDQSKRPIPSAWCFVE